MRQPSFSIRRGDKKGKDAEEASLEKGASAIPPPCLQMGLKPSASQTHWTPFASSNAPRYVLPPGFGTYCPPAWASLSSSLVNSITLSRLSFKITSLDL